MRDLLLVSGMSRSEAAGALVRRLRRSSLVHNAVALYGVHAAGLVLPLITIPYLARVLTPEGWGVVVFAQSFSGWLALVLEYGFYLSATRLVAQIRDDPFRVGKIVGEVYGAKCILLGVITLLALVAYLLIPEFHRAPSYLFWAWMVAVAQGFNPSWYFQGVERLRRPAAWEVATRVIATAGVFLWVQNPDDGWRVLALQAGAGLVWVVIATGWVYREVPLVRIDLRGVLAMLRSGASVFAFRGGAGIYTQANPFLLGLVASSQTVAYYGGAERIIRALIGFVQPASQALYPRISNLVVHDRKRAGSLLSVSLLVVGGLGVVMGIGAFVAAPWLVHLLLGPEYKQAIPVLRILALLPPIIAFGTVLGIQWALPLGLDRQFCILVLTAGALNIALALVLTPFFGALGMASSVVLAETLVAVGLLLLARRERIAHRHQLVGAN